MLRTILIDDEETSLNSLMHKLINHFPQIDINAVCSSAIEGMDAITRHKPDLVFLDIEMPIMNGFTLLQNLEYRNFELIFVTAYDHYAIKAIKFSALDYLVKPVEIEELQNAIQRAEERFSESPNKRLEILLENLDSEKKRFSKIAIPSVEGLEFLSVKNILYLEASSNYTTLYLEGKKKYVVSKTLKEFEELLPEEIFVRIHHSCIINKNYVEKYLKGDGGQVVLQGNIILDISKRKKADFLRAMEM